MNRKTLLMAAVGGMLAGLAGCAETPPPQVPGAPAADPEGSRPAQATPGGEGSMGDKMSCSASMMKTPAPAQPEAAPAGEKHACGGANGCGAMKKPADPTPK